MNIIRTSDCRYCNNSFDVDAMDPRDFNLLL